MSAGESRGGGALRGGAQLGGQPTERRHPEGRPKGQQPVEQPFIHDVVRSAMDAIREHELIPDAGVDVAEADDPAGIGRFGEGDACGVVAAASCPIVLMVSGGSDSTAMCLVAHELAEAGRIDAAAVTVLHVHHGLRGADADGDALFVQRLAGLCGFGFEVHRIDIQSRLESFDGNVENAGRFMRYELAGQLLDQRCREAGIDPQYGRIWVAHTRDDRVETFFMRAIVGTGPGGLASIRYSNGRVARPLLDTTREQLRSYIATRVAQLGWQLDAPEAAQVEGGFWREDATNYETDGFRTFVRHELVPIARKYNPSLGKTLARTMNLIADESDAVEAYVDRVAREAMRAGGAFDACSGAAMAAVVGGYPNREDSTSADEEADPLGGEEGLRQSSDAGERARVELDFEKIAGLEKPFLRRLLYSVCKDLLPYAERIELKHIDLIAEQMHRPSFAMDLPGGVRAYREYGLLVFERPVDDTSGIASNAHACDGQPASSQNCATVTNDAGAGTGGATIVRADIGSGCVPLPVPGEAAFGDFKVSVSQVEAQSGSNVEFARMNSAPTTAFFDAAHVLAACGDRDVGRKVVPSLGDALELTNRRDGDAMCPLGMRGARKKLSDIFVDKKVPRARRDETPVVRAGDCIVWVVGVAADERFKVRDGHSMLRIDVERLVQP